MIARLRGGGCAASKPIVANPDGTIEEKIQYIDDEVSKAGGVLLGSKEEIVKAAAILLGVPTVRVHRKRGETERHEIKLPEIVDNCVRTVKARKAEAEARRERERAEENSERADGSRRRI